MRSSPEQATAGTETGRIFDARRFCVHDGDGIRTTVFLKGCPLNCAWCQNPEGISSARKPVWFQKRCIGCRECVKASRNGGVFAASDGIRLNVSAQEDWEAITDACPTGALRFDSRDVTADELMKEIMLDAPFFAHGGGVTLSGGDPLAQLDFSRRVLEMCRENGVNTAIETEMFANYENCASALQLCDVIFADLKLFDPGLHLKYTGAGNELILENIRRLLTGDLRGRVVIRTPMIPGITATEENIARIARFISDAHPDVKYELLNYNPLAAAKYPLAGREYCFKENRERFTAREMEAFAAIAGKNGVKNPTYV